MRDRRIGHVILEACASVVGLMILPRIIFLSATMAFLAPDIGDIDRCEASESVDREAQILSDQIRRGPHFIALTNAGISTSTSQLKLRALSSPTFNEHNVEILRRRLNDPNPTIGDVSLTD